MRTSSWRLYAPAFGDASTAPAFNVAWRRPSFSGAFGGSSPANDSAPSWWRAPAWRCDGSRTDPQPAKTAPEPTHEFTRAEAAALADAGIMPLVHYLKLADRNGWAGNQTPAAQAVEPTHSSHINGFARVQPLEKKRLQGRGSAKQIFSSIHRWEKAMSRSMRLPDIRLPSIGLLGAYFALATTFIFILMVVALAQTP
jgi:hypothetical protein